MSSPVIIETIDRRELLLGVTASAAVSAFLAANAAYGQDATRPLLPWQEAMRKVTGDAKPVEGKITIELPPLAENGNTVPFTVAVDNPMTELDFVKAIHVFATANPIPTIATFRLTPQCGLATVASRMRLAQTQDVVALAEQSTGRFMMVRKNVKVTIGGCGG